MPPILALLLTIILIVWLFCTERRRGNTWSGGLWVPFVWLVILGSRPVSFWFGRTQTPADFSYLEGSPVDRYIYLLLIVAGLCVLNRRCVNWGAIISDNRWLVIFFLYLGISVLWSDASFVSFKRWIKDVGNIIMVLIILSEPDPVQAFKSLLARFAFLLVPLSVVFIKYFPNIGRYLDHFTWDYLYGGVTLEKNALGAVLIMAALGLFWNLVELPKRLRLDRYAYLGLMVLTLYLFRKAHSSTAIVCAFVGILILWSAKFEAVRRKIERFGPYGVAVIIAAFLANELVDLRSLFAQSLGRDVTLTGRTEIWQRVLQAHTNPLFGTGYYSFWDLWKHRIDWIAEGRKGMLNEAHNGYLETYLNSGLVGLGLLIGLLVSAFRRIRLDAVRGGNYDALKLAFVIVIIMYNMTERVFNRLSPIWVVGLFVIMRYPWRPSDFIPERAAEEVYEENFINVA